MSPISAVCKTTVLVELEHSTQLCCDLDSTFGRLNALSLLLNCRVDIRLSILSLDENSQTLNAETSFTFSGFSWLWV